MEASIVVALVAAVASLGAAMFAARSTRAGQQDQLQFQVWKDSVAELRTRVDELESDVAKCHAEKDVQADELGGMRASNQALRMRVAVLEDQVEALKQRKRGGHDDLDS